MGANEVHVAMGANEAASQASEAEGMNEPLLENPRAVQEDESRQDESQAMTVEFESPTRPWWKGNVNLYLTVCYIIVLWCVFFLSAFIFQRPRETHGVSSKVGSCACASNCR